MTETTTITIRTNAALAKKIAALAAAQDRSRNWIIEDALKRYVACEQEQTEGIKDAIAWFATHEGIPHERVMDEMDELLAGYGVPRRRTKK